ncbi:MAG: ribonuclease E/G [Candidatus Lokiarchaeota archaeon]|nr:ribonuclease E/G [Candidatus Harpocratesius repetitus]
MTKPNVFIRGIYSTALTKLFIDAGYPIIFPSEEIQKRFKLPYRPKGSYSKDITIKDRLDRQGISIMFKKKVWEELEKENFAEFPLTHEQFPNLIQYSARFHKNSIYRGLIVNSDKNQNYSLVRLIPEDLSSSGSEIAAEFQTTLARYSRFIPDAKEGIFQVTHEDNGINQASLGSYYTVPGDLIVIVPYNNKIIISQEIRQGRVKKHLFDLGKEIQRNKKYGFIFRTAAEVASDDEILDEVEELEQELIKIQTTITQFPNKIGEIYSNFRSLNLLFTKPIKYQFDGFRREIIPTLSNHHEIKSLLYQKHFQRIWHLYQGQDFSDEEAIKEDNLEKLLHYTEMLMEGLDKKSQNIIDQKFAKIYYKGFLIPRSRLNILHQKLTGKRFSLTSGYIQEIEWQDDLPVRILLRRNLHPGGKYDGLKTPVERGDFAMTEIGNNNWYYISTYYSANREIKGRYYNINTPIEITKKGIHYIDLELDIVENMVGDRTIVDQELLDQALAKKIISDEIYSKAITIAENIVEGRI